MTKHLKYLSYVIRHKWFVFVECCKLGIPLLGILHDWSKLLPGEWKPYVDYFYGYKRDTWPRHVRLAFDNAWNHHQKCNKHHWQYWILHEDDGAVIPLPMPDHYRREMLADWRGAGRVWTKDPDNTRKWYLKQRMKGSQMFHPNTRDWIEKQLGVTDDSTTSTAT